MNIFRKRSFFPAFIVSAALIPAPRLATAQGYTAVHDFDSTHGASPESPLLQNPGDGLLYGTTKDGGANGVGTVFRMAADGGSFTVLHDFNTTDGSNPDAGLILASNGLLYGTTSAGGAFDKGTIFKIDTAGGNFATLRSLDGDVDGEEPRGRLLEATDGRLYGVAHSRGPSHAGTLFRIDLDGGNFAVLHVFGTSTEGTRPNAGLIQAGDGMLYGVTEFEAGQAGNGTVFRSTLDGSVLETVHAFGGAPDDGRAPSAELLEGSDGLLYGTTEFGGTQDLGTLFAMHRDGSSLQILHAFAGAEGSRPRAPIVEQGAVLWGAAYGLGANNGGTLFRIARDGGLFAVVHDFASATGDHPHAAVLVGADGALYGTTEAGGGSAVGVVYRFTNPTAASIAPATGPAAGGTAVTITGTLFDAAASITIGGIAPTSIVITASQITANTPALAPGSLNDVVVINPDKTIASIGRGFLADFGDVPQADSFHDFIESIFRSGITTGCGSGDYCRDNPVTRAQMAVFLLKGEHGSLYVPPACSGVFTDVACPGPFTDWVERLAAEGITAGCGTGATYCPDDPVKRQQMAVFLLKTEHGPAYAPPACVGAFTDVPCPSPFAAWVEQLAAEGITGGCGGGNFCPGSPNTRGQMAVFLTKTFNLP